MKKHLAVSAIDLGAESGRVSIGRFDGEHLDIDVVHRFSNSPITLNDTLHWNTLSLYQDILTGLGKAGEVMPELASTGVDTWGCDFGILDAKGNLLGVPVHYRDKRTDGLIDEVTKEIKRESIYQQSGIAFWPFNTLYQLRALAVQNSPLFNEGKTLLFTPDLLNFWLCGSRTTERSIASTSQCLAVDEDIWLNDLLAALDIPPAIMPEVVPSGTILNTLRDDVAELTNLKSLKVIAPAEHDTGSAVVATPLSAPNAAYLSCGTWSLLGLEMMTPKATPEALYAEFTNEKGACGTIRFLKNIMGLWLIQRAREVFARKGEEYDYATLAFKAAGAEPFRAWVNVNDDRFYAPSNMVEAAQDFCRETGQFVPNTVDDIMRVLLESLVFSYRTAIEQLEDIYDINIPALHITGGGSQNTALCQWTANTLARPVIAGPVEGTALGNMLVQLMALGELKDLKECREVVRRSSGLTTYEPQDTQLWQDAYNQYKSTLKI